MKYNEILTIEKDKFEKQELYQKIRNGITKLAKVVTRTLGPGGLPIIIQREGQSIDGSELGPIVTKDGVTVAESIKKVADEDENNVIQAIMEVARKTNDEVGDGPQPLYSKVLTPTGWVEMGKLKVGDEICGTDNSIQKVLEIYPKGEKEIYKITFFEGREIECCKDHLWKVTTSYGAQSIKKVQELIDNKIVEQKDEKIRHKYFIPNTSVDFISNEKDLLINPYLLGVLLGDGSLSGTGSIELSLGPNKKHILDKLKLPEGLIAKTTWVEDKNYFRTKIQGKDKDGNSIENLLKKINLLGTKSDTKFIPKEYLYSSIETRTELLQGLLDTDGHINTRGKFEYSTVSEQLFKDFIELCRSLGKSVYFRKLERKPDSNSYSDNDIFRIFELKGYKYGLPIMNIEATGKYTEMQCIKVSNPDNLYITDDYIVTHNTTTAILLAEAFYLEAEKYIKQGAEPQKLKEEIERAVEEVEKYLLSKAEKIENQGDIENVAAIASNNQRDIGKIIQQAFEKVGEDGVITLEEGYSRETSLKVVEGFQIDKGLLAHHHFVTHPATHESVLEDCLVVIADCEISNTFQIEKILKTILEFDDKGQPKNRGQAFLIIAHDIVGEALNVLLYAKNFWKLKCAAIKAPHVQNIRSEMLQDIAVLLMGKVLGKVSKKVEEIVKSDLGIASKIVAGKNKTLIFDGAGKEEDILKRIEDLKNLRQHAESLYDKDIINQRIGQLSNGVAVIGVGGSTEIEIKERKDRIEDALNATRAAIEEGIVPGGGITLYRARKELDKKVFETDGGKILYNVLEKPIKQIITNTGRNVKEILEKLDKENFNIGYDAKNHDYVDMLEEGIIDPTKVVKTALYSAISIANLLITCGGSITINQAEKKVDGKGLDNYIKKNIL